ncbi:hypothetical protein Tco_1521260, partial [Tanacetum coccineum]
CGCGGGDEGGKVRRWVDGIWPEAVPDMLEREESAWWLGL